MMPTISERPRPQNWTPASGTFRTQCSDCSTFEISERELILRLTPTEFPGLRARRDRFAAAHPELFVQQASWGAALEVLAQAVRLYREEYQAPPKTEAPARPAWVQVLPGQGGYTRLIKLAARFEVPIERQGVQVLSSPKGKRVLEAILAMKSSQFRDIEIWDELALRFGWEPKAGAHV